MLESCTGNTYNSIVVSASDNPPVLSGNLAHGDVALLWKRTLDDYISPLENISSDRIMGIQCNFPNTNLLFVPGVYLPSSNAKLEELQEYFDLLWALYDSLSARGYVLILGDLMVTLETHGAIKAIVSPTNLLKAAWSCGCFQSLSCKSFGIMLWSSWILHLALGQIPFHYWLHSLA